MPSEQHIMDTPNEKKMAASIMIIVPWNLISIHVSWISAERTKLGLIDHPK
jgi:hypothetical protein